MPEGRKRWILSVLDDEVPIRTDQLAEQIGVSVETVRRDLSELANAGRIRRVHGGALRADAQDLTEPSFDDRAVLNLEAKQAMALIAARLVGQHETVIFDVGTSVLEVAKTLSPEFAGLAVTNSLYVAIEVSKRTRANVHVVGGELRAKDMVCSGPDAAQSFAGFHADRAFIGSGGLSLRGGLTDFHADEIPARQAILDSSAVAHVLADSSKLGREAVRRVCGLDRIDSVITDGDAPQARVDELRGAGIEVVMPADSLAS